MLNLFRKKSALEILRSSSKTGLALGGGAVLGAAHIGVIKYLEEQQIDIRFVSGTSIGALVATLLAFGKQAAEMEQIAEDLDWLEISALKLSKYGLLSNEKLGKTLRDHLGDVRIEDASIPLFMIAADLNHGKRVVLRSGDAAQAVMASACIPGIYQPVIESDQILVDGGLVENVPVSPLLEAGAKPVLAVDLNARSGFKKPQHIIDILVNSIMLAVENSARIQAQQADILITPDLGQYSMTDPRHVSKLIDAGYGAAKEALQGIHV